MEWIMCTGISVRYTLKGFWKTSRIFQLIYRNAILLRPMKSHCLSIIERVFDSEFEYLDVLVSEQRIDGICNVPV